MNPLPSRDEIESIAGFIDSVVPHTPQFSWPLLNARAGGELWVKHENHTPIGSFKVRGALQYFARLAAREPGVRGVIAATRGNYGQAVAFAAQRHGLAATIVVPRGNSVEKNTAMRGLGAELIEHGDDFQAALEFAEQIAAQRGLHFVPSFHRDLVWGTAVSMLNFLQNCPPLDRVYVPIGLGSGICGMIAARDALKLSTRIVGVAATAAPAIARSFADRRLVAHPVATRIGDGLACSTPHEEAFGHILSGVERILCVTDDEIEAAMRAYFTDTHNVAEGAAGAGLAAVWQERAINAGQCTGVVFTGGNIDRSAFARVLAAN
ncbi:MAG: threonine dehydratase [Lacunisphaera sp.]|nr:threonine dehydratase [Lacunisphaera sp.]